MKKNILRIFLCGIAIAVVVTSLVFDFKSAPVYARTADFHVVIDAGHGGRDGGAQSKGGIKESDINLAIAKFLSTELKNYGVGVTMTRETRDSLSSPFAKNKKRDDMEKRRQIIEKVKPDLVISIHLNSFPSAPAVRGLQTFFPKSENPMSKNFAEAIQNELNKTSLNINRRAAIGEYFILECTAYPSVLIECGFLSNPEEARLLTTAEYQKILAHHIANAVVSCNG